MDWARLPPINSLRAFSAVAETESFTLAADALNVTQAAVSQQVKKLESHLGVSLVVKHGRGIRMTDAGVHLARNLASGFDTIARGVERLTDEAALRPVQVTMSPAFAVEWLMPRLAEFQLENPEITLLLNPTPEVVEFKPGGVDLAIRYHDRRRPRPDTDNVLVTDMIVIGAPSLLGELDSSNPESLTSLPWLQELGTNEASDWFTYHGIVPQNPLIVNHMPGNLIMSAVRRGDGITYTARAFFSEDLADGRVIELFSEPLFGIYHIETPTDHIRPEARAFLKWLRSKAEVVTA